MFLKVPRRGPVACCAALLLAACEGGSGGQNPPSAGPGPPPGAVGPRSPVIVDESRVPGRSVAPRMAIVDVTVVPMDSATSRPGQTVLVENGVITHVGDAQTTVVPDDAEVLDGAGRYLMPGLIDMHAHLMTGPGAEHDLILELAAGVTTVRIMWGSQTHLDWRSAIEAGTLPGPALFVATSGFEGSPPFWPGSVVVDDPVTARAEVREQHAAGYDFIKAYGGLQQEPYLAILDEAEQLGIRVVGHVPQVLTADFAIASGQFTIEHFSRFAAAITTTGSWSGEIDRSSLGGLIEMVRLSGTWNCPTLTVQARSQSQVNGLMANPLYELVSQPMRDWLASPQTQPPASESTDGDRRRKEVLAAFVEAGLGVVVGTDTGVRYVLPGFSIHEELRHFAAAGLSPYEVLRAATADAAAALESLDRGTVAAGRRADLLLLDSDPLADVANVNRRVGVMAAGRWFAQSVLMDLASDGLAQ